MKINFIFPGQGSQYNNMGKTLYNKFDYAKKLFNKSNDILNYDIKKICFSQDNDEIHKTIYTQPAIFIYSMICDFYLKDLGYEPISFAGHSLGEISAIVSSDCLDFEKALVLRLAAYDSAIHAGDPRPTNTDTSAFSDTEKAFELADEKIAKLNLQMEKIYTAVKTNNKLPVASP